MRARVAEVLARMSTRDKVGQLFVTYAHGHTAGTSHPRNRAEFGVDTPAEVVTHYHLGGLIHLSWTDSLDEPEQIARLSNGLQRAATDSGAGIPLLISTDQEQGLVTRIGGPATRLPGNMALGASRSVEDAAAAAAITGRELRAMGLNLNVAPVGDVNADPLNPVIGPRSFSSDPALAARLTAAQVRGYQASASADRTVSAVAKHFPGHGDTGTDSHTSLPVVEHTRDRWERLDAPPFRAAIAEGVDAIMSAHLVLPRLDSSGEPATLSPTVLTGMLRAELGFDGLVITDSLQMGAVRDRYPAAEVAVRALQAGADQLLMPQNLPVAMDGVLDAVRSGEVTAERLDASVERVLTVKARRGVLESPFVDVTGAGERVGAPEHGRQAQRITDRTVTVLRDDAGLLPLRPGAASVLVTGRGERATAALARAIDARGPVTTTLTTGERPARQRVDEAVRAARGHELTVVLVGAADTEERSAQRDLARALQHAGARIVAVAVRHPRDAACAEEVRTWIATCSHTEVSMESLARVLFGEVSPSGRLPVAVADPERPGTDRYPFGHGLPGECR